MLNFLILLIHTLESIIFVIINYQLLGRKLDIKNSLLIGIILGVSWYMDYLFPGSKIIFILIYFLFSIILMRTFKVSENLFEIVISNTVALNINNMIDYLVIAVFSVIKDVSSQTIVLNYSWLHLQAFLTATLINFTFYLTIRYFKLNIFDGELMSLDEIFSRKRDLKKSYAYQKLILIYSVQVIVLTLFLFNNYMLLSAPNNSQSSFLTVIILGIFIFFISVITIFIIKRLYITEKEKSKYEINRIKSENIEEQNKIYKQHKHDILNHMNILSVLAQEKRFEELNNYLLHYQKEIKNSMITVNTGVKELDILLYSKINTAQAKNIKVYFNCSAKIMCKRNCIVNLNSILGNLLDNALDACEKSQGKMLSINIKEDPLDYSFIIKNSISDEEIIETEKIMQQGFSTKDKDRGYGLNIVKKLVRRYNGEFNLEINNKIFKTQVDLPKHEFSYR